MKLEHLDPAVLELINRDEKKYPFMMKELKSEIENAIFIQDLSVRAAINLVSYMREANNGIKDNLKPHFLTRAGRQVKKIKKSNKKKGEKTKILYKKLLNTT